MKDQNLDNLLMDPRISNDVKRCLIEHHAEEGIRRESGYFLTLAGILLLGAAAFFYYSSQPSLSQTSPIQNYQISK